MTNQEIKNQITLKGRKYEYESLYFSIDSLIFIFLSHNSQVPDCNNQPSTTFKTDNVWLNAVSDIIKQDSIADGEPMIGNHLCHENNAIMESTTQITTSVPVQNQNAPFFHTEVRSGPGVGIGSSIRAYNQSSPFESSELGKKRTRRNLVTEENSLDDILSQSNLHPSSFY